MTDRVLPILCSGQTVFARAGEIVDAANEPARMLYESTGFEPQSPYWYRTAPA